MCVPRQRYCRLTVYDSSDRLFDLLKSEVVTARGKRIAVLAVFFVDLQVPASIIRPTSMMIAAFGHLVGLHREVWTVVKPLASMPE